MSRTFYAALIAPACVALATLVAGLVFGTGWGLAVLAAGASALVGFHLWQFDRLVRWAEGPLDAPVPEGRGSWRAAFTGLYRRVRTRVAVQRSLAQRLERFAAAAEAIPEAVVVLDDANRIRFANARARLHLGLDPERDLNQAFGNLVRQPEVIRYLEAGDFSDPVTVPSEREPGVTLSIQVVPYGDEQKLLLSRDITRIEATARMRREFIANVSHELKTPLTVVAGFVETLQDLDLDERQRRRYLGLMQEQARNMQRLVDDLLTLSALESEQNPPVDAMFPVGPLLSEVCAQARALSTGRHTIVAVLPADSEALVHGRARRARKRLRQPRFQRRPLYPRRRHDHAVVANRLGGPRPFRGRRFRRGHRARASAASHRTLLSRRPQPLARNRRHWLGPRDRQPRSLAPPGGARDRERARQGEHVRSDPASDARDAHRRRGRRGKGYGDRHQ